MNDDDGDEGSPPYAFDVTALALPKTRLLLNVLEPLKVVGVISAKDPSNLAFPPGD